MAFKVARILGLPGAFSRINDSIQNLVQQLNLGIANGAVVSLTLENVSLTFNGVAANAYTIAHNLNKRITSCVCVHAHPSSPNAVLFQLAVTQPTNNLNQATVQIFPLYQNATPTVSISGTYKFLVW